MFLAAPLGTAVWLATCLVLGAAIVAVLFYLAPVASLPARPLVLTAALGGIVIGVGLACALLPAAPAQHQAAASQAQAAVQTHDQLEAQVGCRTAELRALAAHQQTIREEERKRIARELHDELGAILSGVRAHLSYAQELALREGGTDHGALQQAGVLADSAIDTVRRVITDLRPSVLDNLGLWAALEWHAGQVQARGALVCACHIDAQCAALEPDPARATALFRIAQEALTNVERHAGASHVSVVARACENGVLIEIADNGRGVDAGDLARCNAWGVVGMQERARHFGGQLTVGAAPGGGTLVRLQLPLEGAHLA